mgnify:CR=1 FL=1
MDFSLTWQQQTVVDELEKFLKKEVAPHVEEYDKKKILRDPAKLKEFFRQLQPFGAISGPIPEEFGGMGLDYTSIGLIFQKISERWRRNDPNSSNYCHIFNAALLVHSARSFCHISP